MLATYYPPNTPISGANVGNWSGVAGGIATSRHAGGVNFSFADGSVRFIKNTISSWAFQTGSTGGLYGSSLPVNVTYANYTYTNNGATLGVYQALSTRGGGEVISADAF
jgi:prepilin-type processing-associated H-X9-DG protein